MADYIKREDAIRIARIQGKKAQFDGMVKMSDMAMKYEDWLRGCVHHDGRKGNVYLPCDTVLAIADWIEAHRDVVPVVRCKDCRYAVDYYHEGDCYCSNPKWGLNYFGGSWEFYCADAERRNNE